MTRAEPTFFETPEAFRGWLEKHHATEGELLVGFWKKGTGRPSIDWPQARDQALCFGWIDGVRRSLGEDSYMIRFTPRRKGGVWSEVNVRRYEALKSEGLMAPAGERAFEEITGRSAYAYERATAELSPAETTRFRANKAAWEYFEKRPTSYRKTVLHWVTSAKKPETRERRLATLIKDSAAGRKIAGYDIGRKKT